MAGALRSVEVCAGAGGQALGLEVAGFEHEALVDNDANCCRTLRHNRPHWNVIEADLERFDGKPYHRVDLLAGGLPCPPFSVAGKQLGKNDERNLFPAFFRLVKEIEPRAVLIENVRGFLDDVFKDYRESIRKTFKNLGYDCEWTLLHANDFGVSQLRPRVAIVALRPADFKRFSFPEPNKELPLDVGELLRCEMAQNGWEGAQEWSRIANRIAPTIVGGSKKHGGPDLGPTRARRAWAELGVEGRTIANEAPEAGYVGAPRLTVPMVARIQGFPKDWHFVGKKTPAYRQVGNAFPPPVATALGLAIRRVLETSIGGEMPVRLEAG